MHGSASGERNIVPGRTRNKAVCGHTSYSGESKDSAEQHCEVVENEKLVRVVVNVSLAKQTG
jgi:hypothetical protein